jgi:uncharacterized protein YraI
MRYYLASGTIPLMLPKHLIKFSIFLLILSACGMENPPLPSQTATAAIPGSSPTKTFSPSVTPLPPTSTITPEPLSGLTLWQINVRSGPGIYYTLLGQINQNQPIRIIGVDASLEWFAIEYTSGPEGRGWVTAEYVQALGTDDLPIIGQITLPNGTPAPQASLTQKLNVRSGPGTHYDSLGILPENAPVWLTGRNESGSWLQIDFPTAPASKGWIIAGYVKAQDIQSLPALDSSGTPLADLPVTQATMLISTSTPTFAPAYQDEDSAEKPGTSQVFSPLGIRNFSYSSDLSTPDGDLVDWIAIHPYASQIGTQASLSTSLVCAGNGSLQVQLWQENQQLTNWGSLNCGDINKTLNLTGGSDYIFRLSINVASGLRYVLYTFSMHSSP